MSSSSKATSVYGQKCKTLSKRLIQPDPPSQLERTKAKANQEASVKARRHTHSVPDGLDTIFFRANGNSKLKFNIHELAEPESQPEPGGVKQPGVKPERCNRV